MKNYIHIGPVSIKVNSKNLAFWGYPRIKIGGYSIWDWDNNGSFMPAAYHPQESITWIWATRLTRKRGRVTHSYTHNNGGSKSYLLLFGWQFIYDWQHPMWKKKRAQVSDGRWISGS